MKLTIAFCNFANAPKNCTHTLYHWIVQLRIRMVPANFTGILTPYLHHFTSVRRLRQWRLAEWSQPIRSSSYQSPHDLPLISAGPWHGRSAMCCKSHINRSVRVKHLLLHKACSFVLNYWMTQASYMLTLLEQPPCSGMWLEILHTYSMVQSPSWEASWNGS